MIFDDIEKVYELALAYIGNGRYFAFAIASLLFLFVTSKKIRPRLIYPLLLLILIIGTPWLYGYVFNRDAYWRTFWLFPMTILIAVFCVRLIQACATVPERIGMTIMLVFILVFMGTNMYTAKKVKPNGDEERILIPATNPEKISEEAKHMADFLLTIEDSPRVATRKKYVYELRQYSSKIKLYYGRDIDGFIISIVGIDKNKETVHKNLESSSPDYERVLKIIDEKGYNFLITSSLRRINDTLLDEYGYRELAIMDGSAVYYKEHPTGEASSGKAKEKDKKTETTSEKESTDSSVESTAEGTADSSVESTAEETVDSSVESTAEETADIISDSSNDMSTSLDAAEENNGVDILQEFASQS